MKTFTALLNRFVVPSLTALSENTYLSAVRAGMVLLVPLTIVGGLFLIVCYFPLGGWDKFVAPYLPLLQVPVTATFGLLSVYLCFSVGYQMGKLLKQEAIVSAGLATVVYLMIQLQLDERGNATFKMERLGSQGLFTAILVALVCVRVQKFLADKNAVIRLPASVPPMVYESFLSLTPMLVLVLAFWLLRFVLGADINEVVQTVFRPLVFALNTLPGILLCVFTITLLWSVGINGDNALDAIIGPVFLQYLAANVEAVSNGAPLPYVTAQGFISTFVNVGGTGATLGLALVMLNSKEPGYRKISRLSLPTQIFQINEPIFFGFPIVLNPLLMIPYVLCALALTVGTYLLMDWGWINRPYVNVPWTTPPVLGHFLITGGDWRAAVWGAVSIPLAMVVYYPFAKTAERQRLQAEAAGTAHE
ncbi:MAG TPA: PTS transporter subunit EIIC [Gemmataceae bacterium]|nr:PTS transporter subunit EIIC [Gemmataceae bacterium]